MSLGTQIGWRSARVAGLVATGVLLVGLVLRPQLALWVLWNLLIPILPATFVISPLLWRGVCPLATLNEWSSSLAGQRRLPDRLLAAANTLGIVLLILMVPARRFLFNENGPALAATIAVVAVLAVILGSLYDRRAGFCNAICPVLPVEKLYGQHPLLKLSNPRCDHCTACVPKGCLDVAPPKSFIQGIGRTQGQYGWLATTHGIFAAALPGFIVGYYSLDNVAWSAALAVYLRMGLCCLASYVATVVVVRLLGLSLSLSLALLAAASVTLYYFWAVPLIVAALNLLPACIPVLWAAVLVLVAGWLWRAWPHLQTHSPPRMENR